MSKQKTRKSAQPTAVGVDCAEQLAVARRAIRQEDFREAAISERIRLARFYAQQIVLRGVDALKTQPDDHGISEYIDRLTGLPEFEYVGPDPDGGNAYRCLEAAFALGVATGLLLRPEAFQSGGAR